jgi:hypothetical protein
VEVDPLGESWRLRELTFGMRGAARKRPLSGKRDNRRDREFYF